MPFKIKAEGDGFQAQVVCDGCGHKGPVIQRLCRKNASLAARNSAWLEGFITVGAEWKCEACRVQAWPDEWKQQMPGLCRKYGIPIPGEQQATAGLTPKKRRPRKSKKVPDEPATNNVSQSLEKEAISDSV